MTSCLLDQLTIIDTESHNSTLGDILNDLVEQRKSWLESFENPLYEAPQWDSLQRSVADARKVEEFRKGLSAKFKIWLVIQTIRIANMHGMRGVKGLRVVSSLIDKIISKSCLPNFGIPGQYKASSRIAETSIRREIQSLINKDKTPLPLQIGNFNALDRNLRFFGLHDFSLSDLQINSDLVSPLKKIADANGNSVRSRAEQLIEMNIFSHFTTYSDQIHFLSHILTLSNDMFQSVIERINKLIDLRRRLGSNIFTREFFINGLFDILIKATDQYFDRFITTTQALYYEEVSAAKMIIDERNMSTSFLDRFYSIVGLRLSIIVDEEILTALSDLVEDGWSIGGEIFRGDKQLILEESKKLIDIRKLFEQDQEAFNTLVVLTKLFPGYNFFSLDDLSVLIKCFDQEFQQRLSHFLSIARENGINPSSFIILTQTDGKPDVNFDLMELITHLEFGLDRYPHLDIIHDLTVQSGLLFEEERTLISSVLTLHPEYFETFQSGVRISEDGLNAIFQAFGHSFNSQLGSGSAGYSLIASLAVSKYCPASLFHLSKIPVDNINQLERVFSVFGTAREIILGFGGNGLPIQKTALRLALSSDNSVQDFTEKIVRAPDFIANLPPQQVKAWNYWQLLKKYSVDEADFIIVLMQRNGDHPSFLDGYIEIEVDDEKSVYDALSLSDKFFNELYSQPSLDNRKYFSIKQLRRKLSTASSPVHGFFSREYFPSPSGFEVQDQAFWTIFFYQFESSSESNSAQRKWLLQNRQKFSEFQIPSVSLSDTSSEHPYSSSDRTP